MMGSRILCKLVPKSADYTGGFGGKPEFTPLDVAGALSYVKLNEFETRYIRAKLLQSESFFEGSTLWEQTKEWGRLVAQEHEWDDAAAAEQAALVVMQERIDPLFTRCNKCKGTGILRRGKMLRACGKCDGTTNDPVTEKPIGDGRRSISNREYGRRLGVNHETFSATWRSRMILLHAYLVRADSAAHFIDSALDG